MRFIILFSNWRHLFPWYWTLFSKAKDVEDNICTHFISFEVWRHWTSSTSILSEVWWFIQVERQVDNTVVMRSRETLPSHMSLFSSVMEHIKSTRHFIFCTKLVLFLQAIQVNFFAFLWMNLQTSNITITCKYNKKTHNQLKKCSYKPQNELTK